MKLSLKKVLCKFINSGCPVTSKPLITQGGFKGRSFSGPMLTSEPRADDYLFEGRTALFKNCDRSLNADLHPLTTCLFLMFLGSLGSSGVVDGAGMLGV